MHSYESKVMKLEIFNDLVLAKPYPTSSHIEILPRLGKITMTSRKFNRIENELNGLNGWKSLRFCHLLNLSIIHFRTTILGSPPLPFHGLAYDDFYFFTLRLDYTFYQLDSLFFKLFGNWLFTVVQWRSHAKFHRKVYSFYSILNLILLSHQSETSYSRILTETC